MRRFLILAVILSGCTTSNKESNQVAVESKAERNVAQATSASLKFNAAKMVSPRRVFKCSNEADKIQFTFSYGPENLSTSNGQTASFGTAEIEFDGDQTPRFLRLDPDSKDGLSFAGSLQSNGKFIESIYVRAQAKDNISKTQPNYKWRLKVARDPGLAGKTVKFNSTVICEDLPPCTVVGPTAFFIHGGDPILPLEFTAAGCELVK